MFKQFGGKHADIEIGEEDARDFINRYYLDDYSREEKEKKGEPITKEHILRAKKKEREEVRDYLDAAKYISKKTSELYDNFVENLDTDDPITFDASSYENILPIIKTHYDIRGMVAVALANKKERQFKKDVKEEVQKRKELEDAIKNMKYSEKKAQEILKSRPSEVDTEKIDVGSKKETYSKIS